MRIFAIIVMVALILGIGAFFYVNRDFIAPSILSRNTDDIKRDIDESVKQIAAKFETKEVQTRQEVVIIREDVKKKVNSLPPDRVADGLNLELQSFRRMEVSSAGISN